ncbi:MAG TPA: asparagine synthase (glutamine-hydrolyzing), partial [Bryobacteraceae bacterium]|nr:asparagine synthase (glutamine-hydrolyzing) [Bryobacteraceae bacterium]
MCGIAGFTRIRRVPAPGVARRITEALYHRGPDQQGVYEGAAATLCAVRLKVIDLGAGDQPLASEDGDTVLVFNGEIYNHLEVRAELARRGHRFRTQCDTETVLAAFREWDTGCFTRLRGMFALAVWTESRKRLVLARDRMGIKPLYYLRQGEDISFGSELKAILEDPDTPRHLDVEALGLYLSANYVPGPRTLIEAIRKLPPGHYIEWRPGEFRMESWWRLPRRSRRISLPEAKDELDWLLEDAVREQLVSDVPLGIWASGGLDSTTVLHYAAQHTTRRLKTFSISFSGRSFDESRYFREIASHYGTEHHEFDVSPDLDLAGAIEDFAFYSDEPCADAGALPVWYLARMCREQVTVALSGDGADELFGGYLTYLADRMAQPLRRAPLRVRRSLASILRRCVPVSDEKIGVEYMLKRWVEGSWLDPDEAHFFWNGTFCGEERRLICPATDGNEIRRLVQSLDLDSRAGVLSRYLLLDQNCYLPDDILHKSDRMSMAHSLEMRPPFLDHRIVEFAASLPERFKIRGFQRKFLLRETMRGKLPRTVIERKKVGFDIPAHDWFRGPLRGLLMDTLTPQAVAATEIFSAPAVERLIRDHMERRINAGYHLWGLLVLFLWMKRWRVEIA